MEAPASGNAKIIFGLFALGTILTAGYFIFVYKPSVTPEQKFTRVINFIKNEA